MKVFLFFLALLAAPLVGYGLVGGLVLLLGVKLGAIVGLIIFVGGTALIAWACAS